MKKLLLVLLILALGYLTYNTVANGTVLAGMIIPSYKTLTQNNEKLEKDKGELAMTINTNYSVATGSVATAKAKFNKAKQEYDSLAANATDEQLEAAMKEEEFLLDYLWIVIGNYAEDNNVKFWMNTTTGWKRPVCLPGGGLHHLLPAHRASGSSDAGSRQRPVSLIAKGGARCGF